MDSYLGGIDSIVLSIESAATARAAAHHLMAGWRHGVASAYLEGCKEVSL